MYEYQVISFLQDKECQDALNRLAKEGWWLAAGRHMPQSGDEYGHYCCAGAESRGIVPTSETAGGLTLRLFCYVVSSALAGDRSKIKFPLAFRP